MPKQAAVAVLLSLFMHCTIPIQAQEPPQAVCRDITVSLDASGSYTLSLSDIDNGSTGYSEWNIEPSVLNCVDLGFPVEVTLTVSSDTESDSCVALVTPIDDIAPDITCNAAEIYLNDNGMASLFAESLVATVNDGCSFFFTYGADRTEFTCNDLGTNLVAVTVSDQSGNTATCQVSVIVRDLIFPMIQTCPTNRQLWVASEASPVLPDLTGEVVAFDNCGAPILQQDPPAGSSALPGLNLVTVYVRDAALNSLECPADVLVSPVEPPAVTFAPPQPAQIRFATTNGLFYAVDYTETLNQQPQSWLLLSNNIAGTGGLVTVNDPAGANRRAYRVRALLP